MSLWYQWFIPAPRITMDLPSVFLALSANSRAVRMMSAGLTPVTHAAQAGV
jgi:hypothetical protein